MGTKNKIKMTIKGYLLTGILVWLPVAITLWLLSIILGALDSIFNLLPKSIQPAHVLGFSLPGLGAIISILLLLFTGILAANVFGNHLIILGEKILSRIPFVSSIYRSVKQVSDTLLSDSGQAFRKAILVQFPHEGVWTIAFLTGKPALPILEQLGSDEVFISVYVPTTPNPTSGYFVVVAQKDTRELNISVDDALKYVISMGVVSPNQVKDPSIKVIKE